MNKYFLIISLCISCVALCSPQHKDIVLSPMDSLHQQGLDRFITESFDTKEVLRKVIESSRLEVAEQNLLYDKYVDYIEPTLAQLPQNDPALYAELSLPIIAYQEGKINFIEAKERLESQLSNQITALRLIYNINKVYDQHIENENKATRANYDALAKKYTLNKHTLGFTATTSFVFGYMIISKCLFYKWFWPFSRNKKNNQV